jgi:hypothetical protein
MLFLKAGDGYSRIPTPKLIIQYIANNECAIVFVSMEARATNFCNKYGLIKYNNHRNFVILPNVTSLNI